MAMVKSLTVVALAFPRLMTSEKVLFLLISQVISALEPAEYLVQIITPVAPGSKLATPDSNPEFLTRPELRLHHR